MKEFEFYLKKGDVKKVSVDKNLAGSLKTSAMQRLEAASSVPLNEKMCKIIFENSYEAVREAADAILAMKGYKSYSHEAAIAFLAKEKILEESKINVLDLMRRKRNRMKYYGRKSTPEEAHEALNFAKKILPVLIRQIEK